MKRGGRLKCEIVLLFLSAGVQAATGAAFLFSLLSAHPRPAMLAMEIHEWNGPILVTLILVHVLLNREWIKNQLLRRAAAPSAEARR